jgi:hypothetical protein
MAIVTKGDWKGFITTKKQLKTYILEEVDLFQR